MFEIRFFSGWILALGGLALMVPNAFAFIGLVLVTLGLELHVRFVEEPYLLRTHREHYRAYARIVGRFVPGIGRVS